jgi:hypothetical protein
MVTYQFIAGTDVNGLPIVTVTLAGDGQGSVYNIVPSFHALRMVTEGYGTDALFRLVSTGNDEDDLVFNRSQILPAQADNATAFAFFEGLGFGANNSVNVAGGGGGGDATAANQVIGNASLSSIDGKLTSQSTAANQSATNTKLDTVITNQGTAGAGAPVIAGTGIIGWLREIDSSLTTGIVANPTDVRTFGQRLVQNELTAYKYRTPVHIITSNAFVTPAGVSLANGTNTTPFQTSAINDTTGTGFFVSSGGAGALNDTALGTGARTVLVTGTRVTAGVQTPDSTETITMNGVIPVASAFSNWLRIDSIEVSTVGSSGTNLGIINIPFGAVYQIIVGQNRMQTGGFNVPANREGFITGFVVTPFAGASNQDVIISVFSRPFSAFTNTNTPRIKIYEFAVWQQGSSIHPLTTPIRILNNQDVELFARSTTGNLGVHVSMDYYIKQ